MTQPNRPARPDEQPTPDALRGRQFDGTEPELWDWIHPRLRQWAVREARRYHFADAETFADDVANDVFLKVSGSWSRANWTSRAKDGSGVQAFFYQAVKNAMRDEIRRRDRRPGDYGAAAGDADRLHAVGQSVQRLTADLDDEWQRVKRAAVKRALRLVRVEFRPEECAAFHLFDVDGFDIAGKSRRYSARDVAEQLRERFPEPGGTIDEKWVQLTVPKIRRRLRELFAEAGVGELSGADTFDKIGELLREPPESTDA